MVCLTCAEHNLYRPVQINYASSLGAGVFADEGAEASMAPYLVNGNKTKLDVEGAAVYIGGMFLPTS